MSFRYYKRIKISKGHGLNISKSGASYSYRSKYGSVGSKGFSIRTGIPGLTYNSRRSKKSKSNDIFLIIMIAFFVVIVLTLIIWNLIDLIKYIAKKIKERNEQRKFYKRLKQQAASNTDENISFFLVSKNLIPPKYRSTRIKLESIFVRNFSTIQSKTQIFNLKIGRHKAIVSSGNSGDIIFYKFPGDRLKVGDVICKINKS